MTLIELMVAMLLGLIVILAAALTLNNARKGFFNVDAASQLRDNSRFASDLVERVGVQAGYRDVFIAASPPSTDPARAPNVSGFNNAIVDPTTPLTTSGTRNAGEAGQGSDVLILRYQASQLYSLYDGHDVARGGIADQTMIDCAGNAQTTVPDPNSADGAQVQLSQINRVASIFSVAMNQGEPALMCTYSDTGAAPWVTKAIVQGVENFQVLYGVDGVTPGTAPAATATPPNVPMMFLRADQMVVNGDANGTAANWRRVRSVRVGMVVRGPLASRLENSNDTTAQHYFPFGLAKSSAAGADGSAFASPADVNTDFAPPLDTRLRQTVSFTIHLRNDQEQ